MLRDEQIKRLIENYNISFTVDLKAASYCGGLMLGRHPCIWCTWDKRSGLSRIEWKPQSSSHHLEMLIKLCDQYQGDGVGVVSEQGAESIYWRAPRSGRILSYKGNPYPYLHGRYLERTVLFSIIFLDTFSQLHTLSFLYCYFCICILLQKTYYATITRSEYGYFVSALGPLAFGGGNRRPEVRVRTQSTRYDLNHLIFGISVPDYPKITVETTIL